MRHMFSVLRSKDKELGRKSFKVVRTVMLCAVAVLSVGMKDACFFNKMDVQADVVNKQAQVAERMDRKSITGFLRDQQDGEQIVPAYRELAKDTLLGVESVSFAKTTKKSYFEVFMTPRNILLDKSVYNNNWLFDAVKEQNEDAIREQQANEKEKTKKKLKKEKRLDEVIKLSKRDREVLLRIVESEAGDEDVEGRMLVANVVLNRVNCKTEFPDNVHDVVFDHTGGVYQFSPIADGKYASVTVTQGTRQAVHRVLCGEDQSKGALYFMSRQYADADNVHWFDNSLTYLMSYADHDFYK